jgi:hypothetical protein
MMEFNNEWSQNYDISMIQFRSAMKKGGETPVIINYSQVFRRRELGYASQFKTILPNCPASSMR